ncbi:MAG: VOC family protein [Candidatus Saccharimonadales bacterium]
MKELIGDYESFIMNISTELPKIGIDRSELAMMDHICYRVATSERYQTLKNVFSDQAIFLGEADVSGRNISSFEFKDYLDTGGWIVPYIELPEPKKGSPYPEGLEHAELVVIGGLERFLTRHGNLNFNHKGMHKKINPELGLKTNTLSVKFHEQSLGAVVRIEQRLAQD